MRQTQNRTFLRKALLLPSAGPLHSLTAQFITALLICLTSPFSFCSCIQSAVTVTTTRIVCLQSCRTNLLRFLHYGTNLWVLSKNEYVVGAIALYSPTLSNSRPVTNLFFCKPVCVQNVQFAQWGHFVLFVCPVQVKECCVFMGHCSTKRR